MSLIPGQVIHNRYKVIALLSPGGMSAVYEVIDITLNLRCALKEMMPYPGTPGAALPQLREQFQQEARLLAELRHPNLPRVTDHFEEDGNVYLVMDFIYGKRLDEVVNQNEEMSEAQVLDWARQLLEALAYCHKRGVIHRDVKPQNVIITSRGQAVLVDFGLAKLVDPTNPRTRTVMRGLGTPEYAPPEQYDTKEGRTDSRTDIYSLGATLYHALAGEPPPMLADRVVDPGSLVPIQERRDDISPAISRAVVKAMALRPSQRFQDITEMHEALFGLPQSEQIESVAPSEVGATPSAEPSKTTVMLQRIGPMRLPSRYRIGAVLVVVSLVSLVIVTSLVAGGMSGESTPTTTVTPTAFVTATPTRTPTATSTPTATFTASPTSRPPTRQPTRTPDESDSFYVPIAPTTVPPTPTRVYISPSPTYTPIPSPIPTNTPEPPRPRPPNTPTNTPPTPDTPTPRPPTPVTPTTRPPPTSPPTDTPTSSG